MTLPYSKRKDETPEAFEAFATYRDMGTGRSLIAVSEKLCKSEPLIARWSKRHGWVKRVHAYDAELDRRKRLVDLREIEKMRRRQTQTALAMQDLGNIELWKMLNEARASQTERGSLDEKTILKLIEKGTTLERLNRGEPGEITQSTGEGGLDFTGLSLTELKQLRALRHKVRARQLAEAEANVKDEDD
jgi:hypothetical protein